MNAEEAREQACHALAARLRAWGVPDPEVRARDYMAGLHAAGWRWQAPENRPTPPRRAEECTTHAGQYAARCAGCAADAKAIEHRPEPEPPRPKAPKPPLPRFRTTTKETP
ncbi:hypothetical protein [Nocardioides sp. J54]|uniref:hypothetical protein n=1 Tax=Nocardioides sp. J54 TaxID=935866 RepID=UPI00048B8C70|nr:hypothetical protein [Nocardioides sp. J54]